MTRTTNDILSLTELYHHGPEDIVISVLKFLGAFIILMYIDVKLTLIVFLSAGHGRVCFYFNKKMNVAPRVSKDRIGDINAQVEDSLSGIRVVKSFTNEHVERKSSLTLMSDSLTAEGKGIRVKPTFTKGWLGLHNS